MGTDAPLGTAFLTCISLFSIISSSIFAQVTNPPIDSIREEIVTATNVYVGTDGNLLEEKEAELPCFAYQQPHFNEFGYVENP